MTAKEAIAVINSVKFILDNDHYSDDVETALDMTIKALKAQDTAGDTISRQAAIDAVDEALTRVFVEHRDIAEKMINKIPSAQPKPKSEYQKTEQNVLNSELISKKAAIEAINTWDKFGVDERGRLVRWHEGLELYVHLRDVLTAIVNLPSAQPEERTEERTETHACDLINRQALMKEFSDFVRASNNSDFAQTPTWNDAVSLVGSMPSAQPEIIRCKDCKYAHITIRRIRKEVKYCDVWFPDEKTYIEADNYCSFAERRTDERTD